MTNNLLAFRYFDFQYKFESENWLDNLARIDESSIYGLPESLTLLDPTWFRSLDIDSRLKDPRGESTFKSANENAKCNSELFWDYNCPFVDSKVHVDHIFPFSRGGATHHLNATYLCEKHNFMKFTDIHILPWEMVLQNIDWVRLTLGNIFRSSRKLVGMNLYIPEKQISRL